MKGDKIHGLGSFGIDRESVFVSLLLHHSVLNHVYLDVIEAYYQVYKRLKSLFNTSKGR